MSDERLFSAAIIQSSLLPLCGVLTEAQYQVIYDKMLDEVGILRDLSPRQWLEKLVEAEDQCLLQDFGELADEFCMRHQEMLDPNIEPRALVVPDFNDLGISTALQPGGLHIDIN